jgi:hypothetical protein
MDLGRASVRDRPGVVQGRGTGQVHVQAQWLMNVLPRHRTQRPGSSSQRDGTRCIQGGGEGRPALCTVPGRSRTQAARGVTSGSRPKHLRAR